MANRLQAYYLEFLSHVRWFWRYWLPRILSWPFSFKAFPPIVLSLIALSFFALFTNQSSISLQIMHTVEQVVSSSFGDEALRLMQYISSIQLGLLLLSWYLINQFYTSPLNHFFLAVERAGLVLIRPGGDRLSFLKRMCQNGRVTLGLGEFKQVLPIYISRTEEAEVIDYLFGKGSSQVSKAVLLVAPSSAGKTRTALEILHKLNPNFVIIWQPGNEITQDTFSSLSYFPRKLAILADDVLINKGQDKPALSNSLTNLLHKSAAWLVATKRMENAPLELSGLKRIALSQIPEHLLAGFFKDVSALENKPIEEVRNRYAGHPGNVIANFDAMKAHWRELYPQLRRVLQAEKYLFLLGVKDITVERLKDAMLDLDGDYRELQDLDSWLELLVEKGFLTLTSRSLLNTYSGYRDHVVVLPSGEAVASSKIVNGLKRREDGEALFEVATSLISLEYKPSQPENIEKAISLLKTSKTTKFANSERNYLAVCHNLSIAYYLLAYYQDPVTNLHLAIASLHDCLPELNMSRDISLHALVWNSLGSAYNYLSRYEDPVTNLQNSLAAHLNTLHKSQNSDVIPPALYMNLANAYRDLSEHKDHFLNMKNAQGFYEKALEIDLLTKDGYVLAQLSKNIADMFVVRDKNGLDSSSESLRFAVAIYKCANSILYSISTTDPLIINDLAVARLRLATKEKDQEQLVLAKDEFHSLLENMPEEVFRSGKGDAQSNLGLVYGELSEYNDAIDNVRHAIFFFQKAKVNYQKYGGALLIARANAFLGMAYYRLAFLETSPVKMRKAIALYQEAANVHGENVTRLVADTIYNLGLAYSALASWEDYSNNIKAARICFLDAKDAYETLFGGEHPTVRMVSKSLHELEGQTS